MGAQKVHVDWKVGLAYDIEFAIPFVCWMNLQIKMEPCIIPGSHKFDQLPPDGLDNSEANHLDQIILKALARSVFIFNSHVWHVCNTITTRSLRRCSTEVCFGRDETQNRKISYENIVRKLGL